MTISHDSVERPDDEVQDRQHQLVVFGVPDDPHRLRDVIAQQLGIHPADAQMQVHSLPGVLPSVLPIHRAARLAEAIRELGVNATAIPREEVPSFAKVTTVRHLRCGDDGLEIVGLRGKIDTTIAWADVMLISVGLVPHRSRHVATPVATVATPLATSHRSEDSTAVLHDSLELLLITENPLRALRIDHSKLNYEYLGDRMGTSAAVNFRWLVQDLVNRASSACVTPTTRSFLEHGLARHYQFGSAEEMKQYSVFHLILRDSAWGPRADEPADSVAHRIQKLPSRSKKQPTEVGHAIKTGQ